MNSPGTSWSEAEDWSAERLDDAVRSNTRIVVAAQIVSQLISLTVLAALYRLVDPSEFGLLGMALPWLYLMRLVASAGANIALVQQHQLTPAQASNLFWWQLLCAVASAILFSASGIGLARWYGAERLVRVCAALSVTLILNAVGIMHQALLERQLRLGWLSIVRLVAQASGGACGVVAAWWGWGVWSLVVQQLVELTALAALAWWLEPWRPQPPRRAPDVARMLRFGGAYTWSSLMFHVAQNADKVLLSAWLGGTRDGQAVLGLYTQAFFLMMKPVYLVTTPVTAVMLPALSRASRLGSEFRRLVIRFCRATGILLFPAGVGLTLVARPLMDVLGGPPWEAAGWLLAVLAPTILAQGLINILGSVFASYGRADRLAMGATTNALLTIAASVVGYELGVRWGHGPLAAGLGVAVAYTLATVLGFLLPYLAYCLSTVDVGWGAVLRHLVRPCGAALVMGLVVWAADLAWCRWVGGGAATRLLLLVGLGVITYGLLARRELVWLRNTLGTRTVSADRGGTDR